KKQETSAVTTKPFKIRNTLGCFIGVSRLYSASLPPMGSGRTGTARPHCKGLPKASSDSTEQQLLGALRCFHHRFDQGDSEAAFFEFENTVHRATRRSSHGILQQRGVVAGFQHHLGR